MKLTRKSHKIQKHLFERCFLFIQKSTIIIIEKNIDNFNFKMTLRHIGGPKKVPETFYTTASVIAGRNINRRKSWKDEKGKFLGK